MASSRFKDFDDASEQREPVVLKVKGKTYSLPGDPPLLIVARIIGASAEGGLSLELAEAQRQTALAQLAHLVLTLPQETAGDREAIESSRVTLLEASYDVPDTADLAAGELLSAQGREKVLQEEMDKLIVDLLGKENADQMIKDGVGYYTYNRILTWVQVAYGLRTETSVNPLDTAKAVLSQLRALPTAQRPELMALLDQFEAALTEEEARGSAAPKARRAPQDRQRPKPRRTASTSTKS